MSNTVGLRELRQNTGAVIKRVTKGESIEITDHGHPIAKIVPIQKDSLNQLRQEGKIISSKTDIASILKELNLPKKSKSELSISDALDEIRSDRWK